LEYFQPDDAAGILRIRGKGSWQRHESNARGGDFQEKIKPPATHIETASPPGRRFFMCSYHRLLREALI